MMRIVSKPKENRSFSIKSIDIEFYSCSEIGSCLRFVKLVILELGLYASNIGFTEYLYIWADVGTSMTDEF